MHHLTSPHAARLADARIHTLLETGAAGATLHRAAGLSIDTGKHLLDAAALEALWQCAEAAGFDDWRARLARGDAVNHTEGRAALHCLLRAPAAPAGLEARWREVQDALTQMQRWVAALQGGRWQGFSGAPITDIVNLGIGGSDLGPAFVTEALRDHHTGPLRAHFVANIDPSQLLGVLRRLKPESTLFVLTSKSFTTQETLLNAGTARAWLEAAGATGDALQRHFVAVTAQPARAREWGIDAAHILPFWEWVGGRFSLWCGVGLPIAASAGMGAFRELLAGAAEMDAHFFGAPLRENIPLRLALLDHWYSRHFGAESTAILPYSHLLRRLPDFLQQMIMESNGKSVQRDGRPVDGPTSAVIWGSEGTNGQHSFHQLLHQGTRMIPAEFILPLHGAEEPGEHQSLLVANCLAQARALMLGRPEQEVLAELLARGMPEAEARALAPHIAMPGNRPSTLILMERLTPRALGALIALYEHRVFAQSVLWNINPFDQWGVELGKRMANEIHAHLAGGTDLSGLDASTRQAIEAFDRSRQAPAAAD